MAEFWCGADLVARLKGIFFIKDFEQVVTTRYQIGRPCSADATPGLLEQQTETIRLELYTL